MTAPICEIEDISGPCSFPAAVVLEDGTLVCLSHAAIAALGPNSAAAQQMRRKPPTMPCRVATPIEDAERAVLDYAVTWHASTGTEAAQVLYESVTALVGVRRTTEPTS